MKIKAAVQKIKFAQFSEIDLNDHQFDVATFLQVFRLFMQKNYCISKEKLLIFKLKEKKKEKRKENRKNQVNKGNF